MAENHPVGFQWVIEARERGAKIIHVDPRFTRTSAMTDIWVPLRAGTDVLFLGGLINYVLEHGKEFREYVVAYTNASMLLRDDFQDTEELDGLFSGWDAEKKKYDPESWAYRTGGTSAGATQADPTLQDLRCVFQVLKRHFARYTPEIVERGCGVPKQVFLKTAEAFTSASGTDKTGASRSCDRRRFCNCCLVILAGPAEGSSRSAGTLPSRAQRIFPRFMTFCRATCPCRSSRLIPTT